MANESPLRAAVHRAWALHLAPMEADDQRRRSLDFSGEGVPELSLDHVAPQLLHLNQVDSADSDAKHMHPYDSERGNRHHLVPRPRTLLEWNSFGTKRSAEHSYRTAFARGTMLESARGLENSF